MSTRHRIGPDTTQSRYLATEIVRRITGHAVAELERTRHDGTQGIRP